MSSALWFVLFVAQSLPSYEFPQRRTSIPDGTQPVVAFVSAQNPRDIQKREAALRKRCFEQSFNHLLETLSDFADAYNHNGAIDVKKVESVKKAWLEVQKNEDWFRIKKGK